MDRRAVPQGLEMSEANRSWSIGRGQLFQKFNRHVNGSTVEDQVYQEIRNVNNYDYSNESIEQYFGHNLKDNKVEEAMKEFKKFNVETCQSNNLTHDQNLLNDIEQMNILPIDVSEKRKKNSENVLDNQVEEAMKEFNNLNSPSLQSNSLPFDQNYLLKYNEEMSNLSLDDSEEKIENNNVLDNQVEEAIGEFKNSKTSSKETNAIVFDEETGTIKSSFVPSENSEYQLDKLNEDKLWPKLPTRNALLMGLHNKSQKGKKQSKK